MRFAIATVFYPGIEQFYQEFSNSLLQQTDLDFKLFIVNDGIQLDKIDLSGFDYEVISPEGTISQNRKVLIKKIAEAGFEWIVFADADDYFEHNRIAVIRNLTQEYDLIANEIVPFSNDKKFLPKFGKVLGNFKRIELDFILDKNLFGLSNVACRTSYLMGIDIPNEIVAVDWFLFTKAIQAGAKACFTAQTKSYYRQWSENIIGIDKISEKEIHTGIKAKYFHYKYLADSHPFYCKELVWISELYELSINGDLAKYMEFFKNQDIGTTFWWENIKNYKNG